MGYDAAVQLRSFAEEVWRAVDTVFPYPMGHMRPPRIGGEATIYFLDPPIKKRFFRISTWGFLISTLSIDTVMNTSSSDLLQVDLNLSHLSSHIRYWDLGYSKWSGDLFPTPYMFYSTIRDALIILSQPEFYSRIDRAGSVVKTIEYIIPHLRHIRGSRKTSVSRFSTGEAEEWFYRFIDSVRSIGRKEVVKADEKDLFETEGRIERAVITLINPYKSRDVRKIGIQMYRGSYRKLVLFKIIGDNQSIEAELNMDVGWPKLDVVRSSYRIDKKAEKHIDIESLKRDMTPSPP